MPSAAAMSHRGLPSISSRCHTQTAAGDRPAPAAEMDSGTGPSGGSWLLVRMPHYVTGPVLIAGLALAAAAVSAVPMTAAGASPARPARPARPASLLTIGGSLRGVAATSAGNAWAVGAVGSLTARTLIVHWNGKAWARVPSPSPGNSGLYGVAATSATNAWAVGAAGSTTLILHWNGKSWARVTSPRGF